MVQNDLKKFIYFFLIVVSYFTMKIYGIYTKGDNWRNRCQLKVRPLVIVLYD